MREKISRGINLYTLYHLWLNLFRDHLTIYCSCIIAKKENNIVRYLSFEKDPIVTLFGAKSKKLKSSLEKKF